MISDWDVIVAGAGPAGSTAAIAARRADPAARVLLLDAAQFPRDKVCGDGVAPHVFDVLAELGVEPGALTAGTVPVRRLRLRSPTGIEAARPFTRPAYVIPRRWFDHRLLDHAVWAGAELHRHRVRAVDVTGGSVLVDGRFRAPVLIAADGAESVVRRTRRLRQPPAGTVALAVRGYAAADRLPVAEQFLTLPAARWPAYAWAFPIGNGVANVGYGELLTDRPVSRAHLLAQLGELLPGHHLADVRGHRLPLSTGRPKYTDGPILLTGDAASLINSLTGEGIYYAVLSGRLAGAAARSADPAGNYRRGMRRALAVHLRQTDLIAALYRRPALIDAVVAAARADQGTFDCLVDLGLAAGMLRPGAVARVAHRLARRGRGDEPMLIS
jgi:geranylgeranyl reductase family protein